MGELEDEDLRERQTTFFRGWAKVTRDSFMVIDSNFLGRSAGVKGDVLVRDKSA